MIENLIQKYPHWLVASVFLILGLFLFMNDAPLESLCEIEKKNFQKAQLQFIYSTSGNSVREASLKRCLTNNSAGSCYSYLKGFKTVLKDLKKFDNSCLTYVSEQSDIRTVLITHLSSVTEMIWWAGPPTSYTEMVGWLKPPEIQDYCRAKYLVESQYGRSTLKSIENSVLKKIKARGEPRALEDIKGYLMTRLNCSRYL